MRSTALLLACLLIAAAAAGGGGYYLEEETVRTSGGQEARPVVARTWITGEKLRKEEGASGTITIFRDDLRLVWVLNPVDRTYFVLSRELMDAMGRMSMSVLVPEQGTDTAGWLQRTGRERRIGDWRAYEVRVDDRPFPGVRLEMWLSTDVPIEEAFRSRLGGAMFDDTNPAGKLLADLRELEGHPVDVRLSVELGPQRLAMSQRLTTVEKREEIEAARFELPDGFREVPNPFEAAKSGARPSPE